MKKIFFILFLVLVSCSKDEEEPVIVQADLIGTWDIHSINGSTDLDDCDLNQSLRFTKDLLHITGAFWMDAFAEENCQVFTTETRYKIEDGILRIEYKDGVSYIAYFPNKNTMKVTTVFDGGSNDYVYKKN